MNCRHMHLLFTGRQVNSHRIINTDLAFTMIKANPYNFGASSWVPEVRVPKCVSRNFRVWYFRRKRKRTLVFSSKRLFAFCTSSKSHCELIPLREMNTLRVFPQKANGQQSKSAVFLSPSALYVYRSQSVFFWRFVLIQRSVSQMISESLFFIRMHRRARMMVFYSLQQ